MQIQKVHTTEHLGDVDGGGGGASKARMRGKNEDKLQILCSPHR